MNSLPLNNFLNRHVGEVATVVGRGPTTVDYCDLKNRTGPVIFLNDSVQLECHTTGPSYLVAVDKEMLRLLQAQLKSIPVFPRDFETLLVANSETSGFELPILFYDCDRMPRERLLLLDRNKLVSLGELYNGSATILTALHFAWFCGCPTVEFVGCDGINDRTAACRIGDAESGYDRRLRNISETRPGWKYQRIREEQERVCRTLGLEWRYVGTPEPVHPNPFFRKEAIIPPLAHFVWLGGDMPEFVLTNIARFRELHPGWDVRVWHGIPHELPDDLRQGCLNLPQLCMRSDVIRTWLLHRHGGIYLDGDVHPVRPFDELLHYEHFFGSENGGTTGTNCVMGSIPNSTFLENLLLRIRSILGKPDRSLVRSAFGPRLLTEFIHSYPGLLNPLPDHYFCLFQNHDFAFQLAHKGFVEIHRELVVREGDYFDSVWPYAIHTYGIPANQMMFAQRQSSVTEALVPADALLRRLPSGNVVGAEVGVTDGTMSSYLLGHHAGLSLVLVKSPGRPNSGAVQNTSSDNTSAGSSERQVRKYEQVVRATSFAEARCRFLPAQSSDALGTLEDQSLDFVFINLNHLGTMEISSWLPKLRAGGWLCGIGSEPFAAEVLQAVVRFTGSQGQVVQRDRGDTWFVQLKSA